MTATATTNSVIIAPNTIQPWRRLLDHAPVHRGQRGRDGEDGEHLDEVREPRRVLERHRRVHVEEAAAVGAEQLDRLLAGDRPEEELLAAAREAGGVAVPASVCTTPWDTSARPTSDGERQQHVEDRPQQVDVEDAELAPGARRQPADEGDQHGDADAGGDEVLDRQAGHLREVGEGRLARVELPVGVREERRGRVEGDVPGAGVQAARVPRVQPLRAQDRVQQERRTARSRSARSARRPSSPGRAADRPRGGGT